jgi:hypothetical protein
VALDVEIDLGEDRERPAAARPRTERRRFFVARSGAQIGQYSPDYARAIFELPRVGARCGRVRSAEEVETVRETFGMLSAEERADRARGTVEDAVAYVLLPLWSKVTSSTTSR